MYYYFQLSDKAIKAIKHQPKLPDYVVCNLVRAELELYESMLRPENRANVTPRRVRAEIGKIKKQWRIDLLREQRIRSYGLHGTQYRKAINYHKECKYPSDMDYQYYRNIYTGKSPSESLQMVIDYLAKRYALR